jgi:hypothetical protein
MWSAALTSLPIVARRATLWGGRVDCAVLHDGQPVIMRGRTATIEARAIVDRIFAKTPPMFARDGADVYECRDAEVFVDELCSQAIGKRWDSLERIWLRELVAKGGEELRRLVQEMAR